MERYDGQYISLCSWDRNHWIELHNNDFFTSLVEDFRFVRLSLSVIHCHEVKSQSIVVFQLWCLIYTVSQCSFAQNSCRDFPTCQLFLLTVFAAGMVEGDEVQVCRKNVRTHEMQVPIQRNGKLTSLMAGRPSIWRFSPTTAASKGYPECIGYFLYPYRKKWNRKESELHISSKKTTFALFSRQTRPACAFLLPQLIVIQFYPRAETNTIHEKLDIVVAPGAHWSAG